MTNELIAALPDGTLMTRKTSHVYTYIAAIRFTDEKGNTCKWFATWHSTFKLAEKSSEYWKNCPSAKKGQIKHIETQIIPLCVYKVTK